MSKLMFIETPTIETPLTATWDVILEMNQSVDLFFKYNIAH